MSCKLFLVPEDVISTWKSEQRSSQVDKPVETALTQMDKNMQTILKNKHISDYDKEKMHSQKLASFVNMRDQRNNPIDPIESVPQKYREKPLLL